MAKNILSPLFSANLKSSQSFSELFSEVFECRAPGKERAGHFPVWVLVGLAICDCPSSLDGRVGHLLEGCTNPLWRPGSGDRSGLQGEGAGRKEAETVRGGRATVAMEGAARYSGIKILTAEDWVGGWVVGEGDGEASVSFVLGAFLPPCRQRVVPPTPLELAPPQPGPPAVPSLSCPRPQAQKAASGPFPEPVHIPITSFASPSPRYLCSQPPRAHCHSLVAQPPTLHLRGPLSCAFSL